MPEEELIRSVRNGDTEQFGKLVQQYQQQVFRIAMGFVHQQQDAEDIAQEVFIKVFQSLNQFEGRASFSTWLYRITIHEAIRFVKRRRGISLREKAAGILQSLFHTETPDTMLQHKSDQEMIKAAIDSLPGKQRKAFVLSKYEDLSQKEIAAVLSVSEGAVEQLLVRARENLKKKLSRP